MGPLFHPAGARWQYGNLWARYSTLLGPDVATVVVFECTGSQVLEKMLFTHVRKLHITGEVFEEGAFQGFLEFCNVTCHDIVGIPSSRSEEAKLQARAEKKRRKEAEARRQEQEARDAAEEVQRDLDRFIMYKCSRAKDAMVNAHEFNSTFETTTKHRGYLELCKG